MKRKRIRLTSPDAKYGHWWFEIGDRRDPSSESYGWWPQNLGTWVRLVWGTLSGVPGELNGQTLYPTGRADRDPHHDDEDDIDDVFHPKVAALDRRTDQEIHDCLRRFARTYTGKWQWTCGYGKNCRTFQTAAMKHCGLRRGPSARP
ncbi:MAG TPA: hypothetical protein VG013_30390 [Gemmataceae bacterium]|jgi:hypothetical protein|nr:hypothetical protein [Gemmataceae bacterium]